MISFIDKGQGKSLLVLPGWGFDPNVFDIDALRYDLILPQRPIFDPLDTLSKALEELGSQEISVIGWSIGAVVALKMVEKWPHLFVKVILASYPVPFPQKVITEKIADVEKNKDKALRGFYLEVFERTIKHYRKFKKEHEKRCLSFWKKDELIKGLRLLAAKTKIPDSLIETFIIHGKKDAISPIERLPKSLLKEAEKTILIDCGHMILWKKDFYEAINKL